jgi:uncharacterized protein (DUF2384 family)
MKYYPIDEILKVAGEDLINKAVKLLGDKTSCEKWFNSKVRGLGDKTPYEFCQQGKIKDVSDLIGRLEHSVYC